jgi:hypothetical protein
MNFHFKSFLFCFVGGVCGYFLPPSLFDRLHRSQRVSLFSYFEFAKDLAKKDFLLSAVGRAPLGIRQN